MLSFIARLCCNAQFFERASCDFFMNFLVLRFPYIFGQALVLEELLLCQKMMKTGVICCAC